MTNEIKCLQDLESTCSDLLINAEIELSIDNSKVVNRIFQYKRMRDMLDDLIYDMNQEYRQELDEYLEQNQTVYVS
jgi:hypothetical protein